MKRALLLGFTAWLFTACATYIVEEPLDFADPVVVDHGLTEEIVGYEDVVIDTAFPYPGRRALSRMDLDEVTCDWDWCFGTYTATVDLVEWSYDITVNNRGTAPAYGLTAGLHVRVEEPDPYDPYATLVTYETVDLYLADILDPGWDITISYRLYDNEEVLEFMGIEWDDWDTYCRKLKEDNNHYTNLAKKGTSKRITIKKSQSKP